MIETVTWVNAVKNHWILIVNFARRSHKKSWVRRCLFSQETLSSVVLIYDGISIIEISMQRFSMDRFSPAQLSQITIFRIFNASILFYVFSLHAIESIFKRSMSKHKGGNMLWYVRLLISIACKSSKCTSLTLFICARSIFYIIHTTLDTFILYSIRFFLFRSFKGCFLLLYSAPYNIVDILKYATCTHIFIANSRRVSSFLSHCIVFYCSVLFTVLVVCLNS